MEENAMLFDKKKDYYTNKKFCGMHIQQGFYLEVTRKIFQCLSII